MYKKDCDEFNVKKSCNEFQEKKVKINYYESMQLFV